jgi:HAD superfamily hydrolase (TIGR01458 family)
MSPSLGTPSAILLDIDGVLFVGDEPIPGAVAALEKLRAMAGLRLLTNTTSQSRRQIVEHLRRLGFDVTSEEVLTPAALAVRYCAERGHAQVELLVSDALREDLGELEEAPPDGPADAVVLGDLGDRVSADLLNRAFRLLMDGAELVALQHNRYWRRADGLALDVGAYSAALEYATGVDAAVVGKPSPVFFESALADLGAEAAGAVMVGDDVEGDVGGALDAGLRGILVRTGKYRDDLLAASGVEPTVIVDSIADVPPLVER